MIIYKDKKYKFTEYFNPQNGMLIRSDVHGYKGVDPVQRSFPELIDIGIMGSCHVSSLNICKNAGIDCYQQAKLKKNKNMSLKDYERIVKEASMKTFQVALGGAGDPNKHENFKDILALTQDCNIVPNLTTSGIFITNQEIEAAKRYCGAVAISFYTNLIKGSETNPETISAINKFVSAGCVTNIHYVLSSHSIEEAIFRLQNNFFPAGINAIIFLLYKPVGFGLTQKTLTAENPNFKTFLQLIENKKFHYKIGFDTCCTPAIFKNCPSVSENSLDFCEAARFSMYIDAKLNAYPCSFDCGNKVFKVSMKNQTIRGVWESKAFSDFRLEQNNSCPECTERKKCSGNCVLALCDDICRQ